MNYRTRMAALLLVAAAPLASLHAQEEAMSPWSGEVSAGFVSSSGNSDTRTANARFELGYDSTDFKHRLNGQALQTRDDSQTTVERYTAGYKLDYNLTPKDFLFFSAEFEKDLFGGVRQRTAQTAGYGRRLLDSGRHQWNVELGGGLRQLEFQEPDGASEDEAIGRFFSDYRFRISDSSRFEQSVRVESGKSNTSTESVSELQLSIIGNIFVALSYTLRHNTDVAEGTDKVDTFTAINLSYGFGT